MCEGHPNIAVCACGAHFAACDTVEALLHITSKSSSGHHWVFIETGVFTAGRDIFQPNPVKYKDYMQAKYKHKPANDAIFTIRKL